LGSTRRVGVAELLLSFFWYERTYKNIRIAFQGVRSDTPIVPAAAAHRNGGGGATGWSPCRNVIRTRHSGVEMNRRCGERGGEVEDHQDGRAAAA